MKVEDLRKMTVEELKEKEKELRKKLMELRFQNSVGTLDKPSEIRKTKKDIARILRVLREMELKKEVNG